MLGISEKVQTLFIGKNNLTLIKKKKNDTRKIWSVLMFYLNIALLVPKSINIIHKNK